MARRRGRSSDRHVHRRSPRGTAANQVIYGVHPVRECLRLAADHLQRANARLMLARRDDVAAELRRLADDIGLAVEDTDTTVIDSLTAGEEAQVNHQGIALYLGPFPYVEIGAVIDAAAAVTNPRVVVLDQVQDPHNLGSLLRSAAAFGVSGLVLPRDRSAGVTAAAIRVSAGGAFHVPVARVTNLARSLDELREAGFWIYGACARDGSRDARDIDWAGPAALVLGAEDRGLRRLTRERCDALVRIPMTDPIDSLNVAVAGSILMYASRAALDTP